LMAVAAASPHPLSFKTVPNGNLECKLRIRTIEQDEIIEAVRRVLSTFCDVASKTTP